MCCLPLTSGTAQPGPSKSGASGESWVVGGPVENELDVFEAYQVAW